MTSASATDSTGSAMGSATGSGRTRRAPDPLRRRLSGAVLMVLIGSFLPWIYTGAGGISGARGAGLWTFYAAMLGLAAVILPIRRLVGIQAAIFALAAVALPVWQVLHLVNLVGFSGWFPGPGLLLVTGGGVLAGSCALRYLRPVADAG